MGDTEIVVQDAFGQVQRFSQPYYLSTLVLKEGLHNYTYNLGFLRDRLGTESWHYGQAVFAARHLLGLTDAITTGALLEAGKDLVSGGPEVALRLPIGQLALGTAVSNARGGGTGWAGAYSSASTQMTVVSGGLSYSNGAITIDGGTPHGATISTYDDHRIAMAFATAGLRTPGIVVENPGCTAKSFPTFWAVLAELSANGAPAWRRAAS